MAAASTDDILRRVPPQNLEAEQSVLGAILLENEAINQALEVLNPDDFYRESHREIFRVMTELSDRNAAFSLETKGFYIRKAGTDGFRFGFKPTLKKVVSDRRASLDEEEVFMLIGSKG